MLTTRINIGTVEKIFNEQSKLENLQALKNTNVKERLAKIKIIENFLLKESNQELLAQAMHKDLRKTKEEVIAFEIVPILVSITHIYKNLASWIENHQVDSPLGMLGMSSYIKYEPKGTILIIAPWNYPFQLAINPLVHAIAAGNAIVLKPSEVTAHTSIFIKKMMDELFKPNEIAVIEGDAEVSTALLNKPFNHIFFTGSPAVGKIVMKAAAQHLTSVTLELGGKSPVIVDNTADAKQAAEKIMWAKLVNCGQTCIAPDYLLIHKSKREKFIEAAKKTIDKFYKQEGKSVEESAYYSRIVNNKNFNRVKNIVDDAVLKGANVLVGGQMNEQDLFIAPTLLDSVNNEMLVMQEEIFGPLLPIITFEELVEVPAIINRMPKPLSLYIFSKKSKNVDYLLNNTSAGGTAINELMVTTVNPNLPFGGVNNSGIGKSNGKQSIIEFSNERGVITRNWLNFKMIFPPYNKTIFKWLLKIARL